MLWKDLRDALAKQTGWKIEPLINRFTPCDQLKIIWECSNYNTRHQSRLIVYCVTLGVNEKARKVHTIIIEKYDDYDESITTRSYKIQESNDIDVVVAKIKEEIPFKKADPSPSLVPFR